MKTSEEDKFGVITLKDIKNNLGKYPPSKQRNSLSDFLTIYEASKGSKGFITVTSAFSGKSQGQRRMKLSNEFFLTTKPTVDKKDHSGISLKSSEKTNSALHSFKISLSPLAAIEESSKNLNARRQNIICKTNYSSPLNARPPEPKRFRSKRASKEPEQHSGRLRGVSPYLDNSSPKGKKLPLIALNKHKTRALSLHQKKHRKV